MKGGWMSRGSVALSTTGALWLFPLSELWACIAVRTDSIHSSRNSVFPHPGMMSSKTCIQLSLLDNDLMFFRNTGTANSSFLFQSFCEKLRLKNEDNIGRPHKQHFLLSIGVKSVLKLEDRSSNRNESEILSPGVEPFSPHICMLAKYRYRNMHAYKIFP